MTLSLPFPLGDKLQRRRQQTNMVGTIDAAHVYGDAWYVVNLFSNRTAHNQPSWSAKISDIVRYSLPNSLAMFCMSLHLAPSASLKTLTRGSSVLKYWKIPKRVGSPSPSSRVNLSTATANPLSLLHSAKQVPATLLPQINDFAPAWFSSSCHGGWPSH